MRYYKFLQLLSIDVVIGACAMSFFMAEALSITLPLIIYYCLGASVWLIYTLDHLLDARKIDYIVTPRHSFHKKYFKILVWAWLLSLVISGILAVLYLPIPTIKLGILATVLVIIHLVLVNLLGSKVSVFVQKELGVAVAYATGVLVGPLSVLEELPAYIWILASQVFLLAMINLLEFSLFDKKIDAKQGQTSIVQSIGEKPTIKVIRFFLVSCGILIVSGGYLFEEHLMLQCLFALMWLVLFIVVNNRPYFEKEERYRIWGDMVFMFPLLLLML